MIVYVRLGVLVRCVLFTVLITITVGAALVHPAEPEPAPPADTSTSAGH